MSSLLPFAKPAEHTKRYTSLSPDDLLHNEYVLIAKSPSEHRGHIPLWDEFLKKHPNRVITASPVDRENVNIELHGQPPLNISLRDEATLSEIINKERLLIDISGLPHNVWAPLLKVAHSNAVPLRVLYAEPKSYKPHPTPASATLFDLSVSFEGLAPLPGFAKLTGPIDESKCVFMALLGFEGSRPERLVFQLDPTPKVIPVVGVPGFQIDYPAFTVACNRSLFRDYSAHSDLRLARASCPFEVYNLLKEVHGDFPDYYMYLAPVGTKPHSLGAIWYAINNPDHTEIMFDYPIRKEGRTKGIGVIHIYDFGYIDE